MSIARQATCGYSGGMTRHGPSTVAFAGDSGSSPVTAWTPVVTTPIRTASRLRLAQRLREEQQAVEARALQLSIGSARRCRQSPSRPRSGR